MRKILSSFCLACWLLFANSYPVQAITIDMLKSYQEVGVNATASIDIVIFDLGDGVAPSIGNYNLNIIYDPVMLSCNGATFGDQLDILGWGSLPSVNDSVPGVVNLREVSLDESDDLNILQQPSFTLAKLTFDTLLAGISTLTVEIVELGDAYGDPLTASTNRAQINAVPIPGAIWLFYSGFACFVAIRRYLIN